MEQIKNQLYRKRQWDFQSHAAYNFQERITWRSTTSSSNVDLNKREPDTVPGLCVHSVIICLFRPRSVRLRGDLLDRTIDDHDGDQNIDFIVGERTHLPLRMSSENREVPDALALAFSTRSPHRRSTTAATSACRQICAANFPADQRRSLRLDVIDLGVRDRPICSRKARCIVSESLTTGQRNDSRKHK